jgi:hypothetical protein
VEQDGQRERTQTENQRERTQKEKETEHYRCGIFLEVPAWIAAFGPRQCSYVLIIGCSDSGIWATFVADVEENPVF